WQPRQDGWPADVLDALPEPVIDLSEAFGDDGDRYYYDHVHTNEAGARVLAGEIWSRIAPMLEADPTS
ncbi:MAG: hypothetical protein AAGK32_12780, partial [Actinomycetota bacterium]